MGSPKPWGMGGYGLEEERHPARTEARSLSGCRNGGGTQAKGVHSGATPICPRVLGAFYGLS